MGKDVARRLKAESYIDNGRSVWPVRNRQYDELVKSTAKHPAVFGYMIGNEIFGGVTHNQQFWTSFGKLDRYSGGRGA